MKSLKQLLMRNLEENTMSVGTLATTKNVLIVEDDPALNRLYMKYFSRQNLDVTNTTTLCDALQYLKGGLIPDIVIMDMGLGDGNGTSILDVLCHERYIRTKVIVVSGHFIMPGMSNHTERIDYMLLKPVSVRELATFVSSL
jgi:DNA-binding response OmpR family regulator